MEYAFEQQIGTRRLNGTDFPVMRVAYKAAEKRWVCATVCNGIASNVTEHRTKREAMMKAG